MASVSLMNNRYEVIRRLGEGSEAEIYLVKDRNEHDIEYINWFLIISFNNNRLI